MNGSLRIKTKIDNSGVDKDLEELENKINKKQNENRKYSQEEKELQKTINKYENLYTKADRYSEKLKDLERQKVLALKENQVSSVSKDTEEVAKLNSQIKSIKSEYEIISKEIDRQAPGLSKAYSKLEKIKGKQIENNRVIEDYNNKLEEIKTSKVSSSIDSMTNSTSKLIRKVLKWGVALFSIRSAYSMISRLSNTYLSENEEIANKIASIWGTLAEILGPAINFIVNIIAKAVGYLTVFIKALTGIDIIANRNAKALKKQAKAQKEVNKEMQSFDEANVLQDTQRELSNGNTDTSFKTPELDTEIVKKIESFAEKVRELKKAWDNLNPAIKLALSLLGIAGLLGLLTRKRWIDTRSCIANIRNRWFTENL